MSTNGKQTLAIVIAFCIIVFTVLGWVWSSLDGRVAACEGQVNNEIAQSAAQRATADLRLANIEKRVEEIRQDVKAIRERM